MDLGWKHWSRGGQKAMDTANMTVDLWPDLSEFDADERFATPLRLANGDPAEVFSSANQKTVRRHFRWMRDYGIDGAFVQRFGSGLHDSKRKRNKDLVLQHALAAAEAYDRALVVMYDLSGMKAGTLHRIADDWRSMQDKLVRSPAYQFHQQKPLVAIWGIGFKERHQRRGSYPVVECEQLVQDLKAMNCNVMLGVPTGWRKRDRDSVRDDAFHRILKQASVISPWTVGRYQNPSEAKRHGENVWTQDLEWCRTQDIDYLPVVFPGFSWHNLKQGQAKLGQIPRLKGEFFWSQIVAAKQSGCSMIYVAMFDEVDEGTAIFKCTNQVPVSKHAKFLTLEGLPSDHYLKLTGRAGKLLRSPQVPAAKAGNCP